MNAVCEPVRIASIGALPALPAAVLELLDLLGREDTDTVALAAKLSYDQALTAKVLRLANSSFYGVPRQVKSVAEAIAVLGMRSVRTVVTAAALTGSFKAPACEGFDFDLFWRHAVATAVAARRIAAELGSDAESAFTAGLLHDIGRLVLASDAPERYAQVLAHGDGRGSEVCGREQAMLGIDHATLGASVAEHWRFPALISEAIGSHEATPAHAAALSLGHVVHLADQLVHAMEHGAHDGDALPAECEEAWLGRNLSSACWIRVLAETDIQTRTICAALLN